MDRTLNKLLQIPRKRTHTLHIYLDEVRFIFMKKKRITSHLQLVIILKALPGGRSLPFSTSSPEGLMDSFLRFVSVMVPSTTGARESLSNFFTSIRKEFHHRMVYPLDRLSVDRSSPLETPRYSFDSTSGLSVESSDFCGYNIVLCYLQQNSYIVNKLYVHCTYIVNTFTQYYEILKLLLFRSTSSFRFLFLSPFLFRSLHLQMLELKWRKLAATL